VPADGARLKVAPDTVVLTFGERILAPRQGIQVLDRSGRHVEVGSTFHPGDAEARVAVRLSPDLPDDSYLVRYGIISDDGHPVSGSLAFVVGTGPLIGVNGIPAGDTGSSPAVGLAYGTGRWLGFLGLAGLGGLVFVTVCWPAGAGRRRTGRILGFSWLSAVGGTLISLFLMGPYAAGQGILDAFEPSLFAESMRLPAGRVLLLRLAALAALGFVMLRLLKATAAGDDERRRSAESFAMAATLPLLIGYSGAGHAESGTQPTAVVMSDMLHLAAMAVWLGGVLMLVLAVLPLAPPRELAAALPRFSSIAFVAVGVLVATGTLQSWQQVGSWGRLTDTGYGRLLLVKLVVVGGILVAADRSRRVVQRRLVTRTAVTAGVGGDQDEDVATPEPFEPADVARLRMAVGLELALALVVLAISATLVATAPARLDDRSLGTTVTSAPADR
jgi:copper transport protein